MPRPMSDLMANQAQRAFVGREDELGALGAVLEPGGPRVAHVHGIAGIGKTALLDRFAREARARGATVVRLDCRNVEPTENGLLRALGEAAGGIDPDPEALIDRLGRLEPPVLLAFDTYEVFRLLDTWLRQVFLPRLPENVRVLLFGRQKPVCAWHASPGWGRLFRSVPMSPLSDREAVELLAGFGVCGSAAAGLVRPTHGHPLALELAAGRAHDECAGQWLHDAPLQQALDELTRMFLADVREPVTRRVLEGASVTRRVTVSLLRAIHPDLAPRDAYERLRALPFVDGMSDGLVIHDAVRDAIATSLHAADPSRHLEYRRCAWRQLSTEARSVGHDDLWRYTADMLYLIEDPVVREAFFPTGTSQLTVERAQPGDGDALAAIVRSHDGPRGAEALLAWWRRLPQTFSVVRDREGRVVGLYCRMRADGVETAWLADDPVTACWHAHLEHRPIPSDGVALFCRRWLAADVGDAPGEVQAAIWLDLKRAYMELRPSLRRVYLTTTHLDAYTPVAQRLGFEVLAGYGCELDGLDYPAAVLDFGPGSVDGWLADLAAAELGIRQTPDLLDVDARELLVGDDRIALTPLEFGVMRYLVAHRGKAISRGELLREVWSTSYEGGSNVVDAVIRTLRRKLGDCASSIETVTGVGYRLRSR